MFDRRFGIETSQVERNYLDHIELPESADFQFYEAVKGRHFRRMLAALPSNVPENFEFIDIGCGKGRALILAAETGFGKISGIELSESLVEVARENISKYRARRPGACVIDVMCSPSDDFEVPDRDIVVFLYNPFVGATMQTLIDKLSHAAATADNEIYILYRNPVCHELISANQYVDTLHVDRAFAAYRVTRRPATKADADRSWVTSVRRMRRYKAAYRARNLLRPRAFHTFAVGTSKSGSHSIHGMFASSFRSAHEPNSMLLNKAVIEQDRGETDAAELREYFMLMNECKFLEMESNSFNQHFIDIIVDLFPDARFVLTYRDPMPWLNSWINHTINRPERPGSIWELGLRAQYRVDDYAYGFEEDVFRPRGLFPLAAYLGLWDRCNSSILNTVPGDRLLLIRTERISNSARSLGEFLGIDPGRLSVEKSHMFKAARNHDILSRLDASRLQDAVERTCAGTMAALDERSESQSN